MKDSSFQQVYRLLKPEVRPRLGALVAVFLLAFVTAVGTKAPLMLAKPLWGEVLFPGESTELPAEGVEKTAAYQAFLSGFAAVRDGLGHALYGADALTLYESRISALWAVALLLVLLTLFASGALYLQVVLIRWISVRLIIDLRMRITRHLTALSMRYHGQRKFGDMLSRMSADVTQALAVVHLLLRDLIQQPLMVLVSLGVAFSVAPLPTLAFIVLLPLAAVPVMLLGKRVRKRSRKSFDQLGDSVESLSQMFSGIRTVKAFRAEERELERYREVNEGYLKTTMKMARAVGTSRASSLLVSYIGFAGVLLGVGYLSIKNPLFSSSGNMLVFFGAVGTIYQHTKRITAAVNFVQEVAGPAGRIQALLDEPADIVERPGARVVESLGSGLRIEAVTFSYPETDAQAIADVSLDVRPGETLALVGPSGAGKTTLIDLIARFIDPEGGRVAVDGTDLCDATLDSWTSQFALVGQVPFLFHDTIRENIRYGKPEATQAEIEAAARAAHIHDFVLSLADGYDTQVGDEGSRLSGGQRQRITIARALLKGAPLLLLDEATSALDSESEAEVQRALEELMEGRTVIVIAHRLSTIRNADRIAVLEAGRLVELGSHDELLAQKGVYARLHRVQFPEDREVSV